MFNIKSVIHLVGKPTFMYLSNLSWAAVATYIADSTFSIDTAEALGGEMECSFKKTL